jgi:hypothetical protein
VLLYASEDDGLSWGYVAPVAYDPRGLGGYTYANLILLPSGRLLCFMLVMSAAGDFLGMNHSDDGGNSWSQVVPITRRGYSPWTARRVRGRFTHWREVRGRFYRSPWPILLRDGRLLVVFARREAPHGIGGLMSEDGGQTWSREFIIRDDGASGDLGYPVATELDDGRIFTAYYFNVEDDVRLRGGRRFIGGSFFRIRS